MAFIQRLYIAVLSALQCKKGHKNIIKHKLTYNPTVHVLKRKKQNKKKNKNKNKYDETKCHIGKYVLMRHQYFGYLQYMKSVISTFSNTFLKDRNLVFLFIHLFIFNVHVLKSCIKIVDMTVLQTCFISLKSSVIEQSTY